MNWKHLKLVDIVVCFHKNDKISSKIAMGISEAIYLEYLCNMCIELYR